MTIPSAILDLWQEHSVSSFPKGYGGKEINGIDLSLLDAEIAGCIHMYVHSSGELDHRHVEGLRESLTNLNTIVLLLNSEELMYFNRLRNLAILVLEDINR